MNEEEKNKSLQKAGKEKKKRTLLQKIVNVFLYSGIVLLLLILILFGISQTSTFREYLRETIIEEANSSLNGKLYIEQIDGTIFTSLMLRNTVVSMGEDTLLKAKAIGVMTSPLQLLLKKIHIRYFEIQNASINLENDESGELNLAKLFPPSEEDTTESDFPFVIQIANLHLDNVNLSFKDYNIKAPSTYDSFNFKDIQIKNLNMDVSAKLDISDNIYELSLNHLSFKPNVKGFSIKEFEGEFLINEKGVLAQDLFLKTDRSEIVISASATDINIFDTVGIKPENANLNLQAGSSGFSFDDVRAFAPSLNMLKGKIEFGIIASGTTEQFNLKDIRVKLEESKIEGTVELKNLLDDNLFVNADLSGSYIDQNDIKNLLTGMEVPTYPELGVIKFETLTYTGDLLDFKSEINIITEKGSVEGLINLNLKNEPIQYEITLNTNEIDIEPFAGIKSSLNIFAEINGKGTSPETFDGSVRLFVNGSSVNGNSIDTLKLTADADNKFINYEFRLISNKTIADLKGDFDFKTEEPVYKVKGDVSNLNLEEFVHDTTLKSNINLTLDAEGNGFSQDSLDLFMTATMHNSEFSNVKIDTTRLIIDLRSPPGEKRVINIISDLADITIMGNYKIDQAVDLIVSEVSMLSSAFNEKINNILPSTIEENESETETETKAGLKSDKPLFAQVNEPTNFNYLIDLKDFSLVSAFIGNYDLEIDAEMGGKFESTPNDSVLFTFDTDLRYIKVYSDSEAYFISNMQLDLEVQNSFDAVSTSDLNLDLNTNAEWIFAGSHIYNLGLNLNLENDVANVNLSANPDPFSAKLMTKIDLSQNNLNVSIDTLKFIYGNYIIENRNDLNLSYDGNQLDINQFQLVHNNSELNIKGYLSQSGDQKLDINLHDWRGKDISVNLMNSKPENSVEASINLDASLTGSFNSPVINAKLLIDSIAYGNKTFGKLVSEYKYNNKNLNINLAFLDTMLNKNDTALTIKGNVPLDLSFTGAEENYMNSKPMNIVLHSNGFNLGAFGDILPAVNKLRGEFTSDLKLSGTPSDLKTEGYLKIQDAVFFLEANNLEYNASLLLNINDDDLTLDSLVIANVQGTENGGKMFGSGSATLDNYNLTSSRFSLNGDLKVLSDASKTANSSVYGELVISTEGKVEVEFDEGRIFVRAPILIKSGADITIPPTQSAYQSGSENYIYKFVVDSIPPDSGKKEMDFDRLVDISEKKTEGAEMSQTKTSIFDYDIKVTIEDEAKITYVLSREFDQNLEVFLEGSVRVEKSGNRTEAEGKLKLLEGSTIQFLKTLDAQGSIEFLSGELTNPTLDIVATYRNYYYPDEGEEAGEEIPFEVRLTIKGPLKDLQKKLVVGEENLKVYYGVQSIEDNSPAPQFDASDAVMFILQNRPYQGSSQDQNQIATAAASLAGSVIGGFLNDTFGPAVTSVQLRQVGTATVISLAGRAGNFRYEIGTSTDVYQDLSRANIKIQYPVTRRLFLRLERKESINREATSINEMINEVGIKYIFEF